MEPVIRIEGVTKRFARGGGQPRTLKAWLVGLFKPTPAPAPFLALQGVTFTVQPGEAIGLVGDNGSGKSTLLKLIAGILAPDRGRVAVVGRISALLELGAGFHPDFTGRENVFLNAAILGLSRAEIRRRFDEIVAFAELEAFIDQPVKTYSSGMYMRLAFAIATSVDPDVLLVDEVLAVGDAAFQRKCLERLRGFKRQGKTIVLVTHDAGAVADLCDRAVWLRRGELMADGPVHGVLEAYARAAAPDPVQEVVDDERAPVSLGALTLTGGAGPTPGIWDADGPFAIAFDLDTRGGTHDLDLMIKVFKGAGVCCYTGRTPLASLGDGHGQGRVHVAVPSMPLLSGVHTLEVVAVSGPLVLAARRANFEVYSPVPGDGVAPLHCHWSLATPALPDTAS